MVNNDILGGLRSALTRGYSLEEAMLSFFNAGYKRDEIQEAAKALQSTIVIQPSIELQPRPIFEPKPKPQPPVLSKIKISRPQIPVQKVQVQEPIVSKPVVQKPVEQKPVVEKEPIAAPVKKQVAVSRVSAYTSDSSRIRTITVILVVLLAVLLGILGLMYIFRSQIISFFNSIFS